MAGGQRSTSIFESVHFQFIISAQLPILKCAELAATLMHNGGKCHASPASALTADISGLTHVITETIDFEGYVEADDRMLGIVNASWISTSLAKHRLANPKSHSPDPRLFFSGLVIACADLPEGDKDAIIGGITAMGGLYSSAMTKLVTHIVALDMRPAPCQMVVSNKFQSRIVRPEWFDDCLRIGKRIDEAPYLLPDPAILIEPGKVDSSTCPNLKGALSPNVADSLSSTPESREQAILKNKEVYLAGDLAINEHLRDSIIAAIIEVGGSVCDEMKDCNVYIGHYRHGCDYELAFKSGRTIGNLPWLYWMIAHNRWANPLDRLLHYPIPKDGLPGTPDLRLCLSNYSGESRIFLENLARAAGCEFTKTLKHENTHLITAHSASEKCNAAREWGMHLVNHLWLEESYARCEMQDPKKPRYSHFPTNSNLTEVVGQTQINRKALQAQISKGTLAPSSSSDTKASLPDTATQPSSPVKPLAQRNKVDQVTKTLKATPATQQRSGKENDVPTALTSGRSAKSKAAERLHDLGEDMLRYEKEKKRVGGVLYGGRRKSDPNRIERKRSVSDADLTDGENDTPSKKPKSTTSPPRMRVLVTGLPAYTKDDKPTTRVREHLRELGILITESENNCRYLVAPRVLRTRKFLCAVAQAATILDPSYLKACLESKMLLDPAPFALVDKFGEDQYDFNLDESCSRAFENRGRMLRGWTIWATNCIPNGVDPYVAIAKANGGKCLPFQGRPGSIPQGSPESDTDEATNPEPAYLLSGSTPPEQALWVKFREMASAAGREARIVQSDWLLDAALKQEVRWDPEYEQHGQVEEVQED